MQATVDQSLADRDAALYVLNAAEPVAAWRPLHRRAPAASRLPVITVLNQIDRLTPDEVARRSLRAATLVDFVELHPVSAKLGTGVESCAPTCPSCSPRARATSRGHDHRPD
jgi:GTPase Era involved in 16S rRNA processing